jgi:hypothetical protein
LLVIWSAVAMVLEIPSGAWADVYSRRYLLALAGVLRAVGFALWTVFPSYWAFAAGFVLWGVRSALSSGTRDALLYDELADLGAADRYPGILGRSETIAIAAYTCATLLAGPALAYGGFHLVGAVSVAACLGSALVPLSFPARPRATRADGGFAAYTAALRSGLAEVRHHPVVRRTALLAALIPALAAFDEYLPLLAHTMVGLTAVPLLLLTQIAAMTLGSLAAARWPRLSPPRLGALLAVGAVLLAAGALAGIPIGFLGVAACSGAIQLARLLSNARLQQVIDGTARATVLSTAGAGAEVGAVLIFGVLGLGALWLPTAVLIAALALPWLLLAGLTARWLPPASPGEKGAD